MGLQQALQGRLPWRKCGMSKLTRHSVVWSVQRAIHGEISPGMRAVSVCWDAQRILIRVFYDGPWPKEVEEDFDAGAVTQVVADFPYPDRDDPKVLYEFISLDCHTPLPVAGDESEEYLYVRPEEPRSL